MLDWARVEELQDELGREDFEEIADMFLEEVEDKLQSLQSGAADSFEDDMHFMKGSAANLGFESFRAMCEKMEKDCDTQKLSDLVAEYEQSKASFLQRIKS